MSARDDQPPTIPPPAGEDDAYNAATKVGAMPADVMARLRAEGLLPEDQEDEAPRPLAPRPGAGTPAPAAYPVVTSTLPELRDPDETDERTVLSIPPDQLASLRPATTETPVAFSSASWSTTAEPPPVALGSDPSITAQVNAMKRPRKVFTAVLVFFIATLVCLAIAMVLLGHRR